MKLNWSNLIVIFYIESQQFVSLILSDAWMNSGASLGAVFFTVLIILYFFNSTLNSNDNSLVVTIPTRANHDLSNGRNCTISTCLEVRNCVLDVENLRIYLQPLLKILDKVCSSLSKRLKLSF